MVLLWLGSVFMPIVSSATSSHVDVCGLHCHWGPCRSVWVACAATWGWGHSDTCSLSCLWEPYLCLGSYCIRSILQPVALSMVCCHKPCGGSGSMFQLTVILMTADTQLRGRGMEGRLLLQMSPLMPDILQCPLLHGLTETSPYLLFLWTQ